MKRTPFACSLILLICRISDGADPGDFDGDDRLSIADVVFRVKNEQPIAVGSTDGFEAYRCYQQEGRWTDAGYVYLESLRRGVKGSLPHWLPFWPRSQVQAPLPADGRVSVRIEPATAVGGDDDRVKITIQLTTDVRLQAFSLILEESHGILRVPFLLGADCSRPGSPACFKFPVEGWYDPWALGAQSLQQDGDLRVSTPFQAFLITNGRYVINFGLYPDYPERFGILEPGTYKIIVSTRLPRGVAPGEYSVRIHEASEILTEDSTLAAPELGPPAALTVESAVTGGWEEGIPPINFDPDQDRILGKVEFRLANSAGDPAADGEPVIEGAPGEVVRLRVQMRTEVPLNQFAYTLRWTGDLRCDELGHTGIEVLFKDPETGLEYQNAIERDPSVNGSLLCFPANIHRVAFSLLGAIGFPRGKLLPAKYIGRPFEYFKPLNAWTDIAEVRLRIGACAPVGTEIPLSFIRQENDVLSMPDPSFIPYSQTPVCLHGRDGFWPYDVAYQEGFVRVIEGPPVPCPEEPPPDVGVRYVLGNVSGKRGEIVDVPVMASTEIPAHRLHLGLETVPNYEAVISLARVRVKSLKSGDSVFVDLKPGEKLIFKECDVPGEENTCTYGIPGWMDHSSESLDRRLTFLALMIPPIDWTSKDPLPDYPGRALAEIARLRVIIPDDFRGTEIRIKRAVVPVDFPWPGPLLESGAFARDPVYKEFSPALEVSEGVITVLEPDMDFIRGDANIDGMVDISDAVATLEYLFLGSYVLDCKDTADADDNGEIEITDPIYLLGALFLGTGQIPEPYPGCGPDVGLDGLDCRLTSCGGH